MGGSDVVRGDVALEGRILDSGIDGDEGNALRGLTADNGDDASGIDWCDSDGLRAFGDDVLNRIYLAGECALRRGSGNRWIGLRPTVSGLVGGMIWFVFRSFIGLPFG